MCSASEATLDFLNDIAYILMMDCISPSCEDSAEYAIRSYPSLLETLAQAVVKKHRSAPSLHSNGKIAVVSLPLELFPIEQPSGQVNYIPLTFFLRLSLELLLLCQALSPTWQSSRTSYALPLFFCASHLLWQSRFNTVNMAKGPTKMLLFAWA